MKSCLLTWVLRRILAWSRLVLHCLQHERFVAFLKDFKNCFVRSCEDLCGIALEIVQPRITLSLKIQSICFRTLNPFRTFNGQPPCEACVARFKAALEQEARKSDQEDQISSEEACEARTKAPLELGTKISDMLEDPKMDPSVNQCNGHSPGYGWPQNPKTIWHGQSYTFTLERLAGSKTRKGDPLKI